MLDTLLLLLYKVVVCTTRKRPRLQMRLVRPTSEECTRRHAPSMTPILHLALSSGLNRDSNHCWNPLSCLL
jgi:hypothetical protein